MFCHKCGTQIAEGAAFCHGCGTKVVYADADHTKPEDGFEASNANIDRTVPDAPAPVNPVPQAPAVHIQESEPIRASVNGGNGFKAFVDSQVRATTSFQSAEELLNSKVDQRLECICLAAPTVLICAVSIVSGTLSLAIVPLSLSLTLILGYPLALLVDLIRGFCAKERITRIKCTAGISGSIDTDELIEFLNQNLGYLSPHFNEWGYFHTDSFGRSAIKAAIFGFRGATITSMIMNATSATRICTGFGRKKRCLVVIYVEPDKTSDDPNQMIYYFSATMRGARWPAKHVCMEKTVPILHATMEYYLKYYKTAEGTTTSTFTQQATPERNNVQSGRSSDKKSKLPIVLGVTAVLFLLVIFIGVIGGRTNSESAKDTRTTASSKSVNLSQIYSNEMEGFSFQYPSAWVRWSNEELESRAGGGEDDYPLVFLANETEDLPEEDSYIMVSKATVTQDIIDFLYVDDEQFATGFDNDVSVISTSMTTLDDVPAREITYINSDGIGYQSYFYAIGMTIYRIDFSWLGKSAGDKQRFFDAIIDSYTITADTAYTDKPETVISSKATEGLCFRGIPVDQLFGASKDDIIGFFGEPDSILEDYKFLYDDVEMEFDTWSLPEPYLMQISGGPLEDYTYNGQPFTDDAQKIIEIMGRKPDISYIDYPGEEYGTYFMSYYLDCLGSRVWLDLYLPADEYSTESAKINLYWWNPDTPDDGPGDDYYDYDYPY